MNTIRIFIIAMLLSSVITAQQFKPDDKIPFEKDIISGVLENGMKYFIKVNKKPESRAELRLVVNAGSILEDEDQQGLAHFVEHMAFNGTKNFERNEIVNYLESIGMKFGPDINAYTSFDETIYMLQLPTDDEKILDTGFAILEDWAHNVSFEDEEIDKERGVITEEWRLGRGAASRMRDKQFPILFHNSMYAKRLPIGKHDILQNFEYETLKRFYEEWYRPDLMALIAVGDFDASKIEGIIKERFGSIPAAESPRERKFFQVPDHEEVLIAPAVDPEATGTSISIYYKLPAGEQGTVKDFKERLTEVLYNKMLGARLRELTQQADPPFVMGYSSKGRFIRTKEFYYLGAVVKDDGILRGMESVLTEGERLKRFGFTATELARHTEEMLRYIETSYNERDKRESSKIANEYIRHYLDGEPVPGIEYEYELQKELLPSITLEEVNALAGKWMSRKNAVIMVSGPEKEGFAIPSEEELLAVFDKVEKKEIEAYDDNTADEPLINGLAKAGKVISETRNEELNITEWVLDNGIKVVLKPTDFKNDEILFRAFSPGGNSLVTDDEFIAAATAGQVINQSGVGSFNNTELEKKLSGKVVKVAPFISELTEGFIGSASPKDAETMFQLINLYFTSPRGDSSAYLSYISRVKTMVENREKSPDAAFQDTLSLTLTQYHPRREPWDLKTIEKMDLEKSLQIYKDRFADASDFTFIFVGNLDIPMIKSYSEKYLGSLPAIKRAEKYADIGVNPPEGIIVKEVRKGIEPKSIVSVNFTGPFNWSSENSYLLKSMTAAFKIKIREILREDKGGTYGVSVSSAGRRAPDEEYQIAIQFGCNPERVDELTEALFAQIDSISNVNMEQSYIDKVKEIQRREIETDRKENSYWVKTLQSYYFYDEDPAEIIKNDEKIEKLTPDDVRETAKKYFNKENYVMVVMYPEAGLTGSK